MSVALWLAADVWLWHSYQFGYFLIGGCKVPLTIQHILVNRDGFRRTYPKYYQTGNLKYLFKNTKPEKILNFLKETNFFTKI